MCPKSKKTRKNINKFVTIQNPIRKTVANAT